MGLLRSRFSKSWFSSKLRQHVLGKSWACVDTCPCLSVDLSPQVATSQRRALCEPMLVQARTFRQLRVHTSFKGTLYQSFGEHLSMPLLFPTFRIEGAHIRLWAFSKGPRIPGFGKIILLRIGQVRQDTFAEQVRVQQENMTATWFSVKNALQILGI